MGLLRRRRKEEGAVRIIPLTIVPLAFLPAFFNAKSQRSQDAKRKEILCVKDSVIMRGKIPA